VDYRDDRGRIIELDPANEAFTGNGLIDFGKKFFLFGPFSPSAHARLN
jgi:hypothetical protein